ncbi:hypothetical protein XM53_00935 [Roseovarius atlanticus]|uniref:Uncharacterized protein n=1 Tax=Roseovarius atlanticus TaxID=1641875 RepID=A0A0T5NZK2_9RHOB|nr:hypothetical protein [Roseovarius atlanticus]KRS14329.1 hypothetical protein XM53_00935 [Roseovarius atlanticus]
MRKEITLAELDSIIAKRKVNKGLGDIYFHEEDNQYDNKIVWSIECLGDVELDFYYTLRKRGDVAEIEIEPTENEVSYENAIEEMLEKASVYVPELAGAMKLFDEDGEEDEDDFRGLYGSILDRIEKSITEEDLMEVCPFDIEALEEEGYEIEVDY